MATNRMDSRERTPTHRNYQSLKLDKQIKFKHSTDLVNISGFASHSRDVSEMFNIYSVDYFRNSTLPSDFRRQYQDLYNDSWYCMASLNYLSFVTKKHHGLTASLGSIENTCKHCCHSDDFRRRNLKIINIILDSHRFRTDSHAFVRDH